jgi:primosomal protein N' (replication factor Y) (superfamily II helicase)
MTLDLAVGREPVVGGPRLVEVAVDAAGASGARTYTYLVPEALADLEPGEAVLVEFGRRQALGVVLAESAALRAGVDPKPILERVRADGPLLPPLGLALASWIAGHYLAPAAIVLRAMLPPGMLERLELVAELAPAVGQPGDLDQVDLDLLAQLEGGPRPARDLAAPDGRAGLVRHLRALAGRGAISLDWTLLAASAGPRYERWVSLTPEGRVAAAALVAGERASGRPLGPRQVATLAEMTGPDVPAGGLPAAGLAGRHGSAAIAGLVRRGLLAAEVRERPRRPLAGRPAGRRGGRPPATDLQPAQAEALASITAAMAGADPTPLLLEGVTGGGKTAVYVEAIAIALEAGRRALVLVPEIALALPLVDRLRADLDARIAIVHSGLGDGERADEWRRIRAGDVDVVVGTRLAVLSPLADVGLVIVDEEHEAAYKSDRTPRLQARDTAIELGRLAGAAVVLGSATPAVDTLGFARMGRYRRVSLGGRPVGRLPTVEVVDLRAELAAGERGLLSRRLAAAIAELDTSAGDQAILVLNRRGTASVVLCRDCGHVQACPDCERPLVYHQAGTTLRCHHCGRATPLATRCPNCASPRIRYLGGGTERVEREVRDRFPSLRVGRLDRDVVERRGAAERVVDAFSDGRLDVLVGTSLVAKGLDVPAVTVVGVVSSDIALNLPDERAAERTFQLLTQAVGRAGRGDRPGRAFLQTYQPEHPAIVAVATADARAFYDAELALRERFGSPPYGRLVKLTVGLPDRTAAEREAVAMADRLRTRAAELGNGVAVVGPAPAYIARRADRWRFNVVLRGADPVVVLDGGLEAPWSVDVDPESLL